VCYHNVMTRELLKYRLLLPSQIKVEIHRAEEGGFWAKVKTFPGVAAQGEDILDLIEMVNVAIMDYVEVPARLRKYLARYEPQLTRSDFKKIIEDYRHKQLEEVVTKVIQGYAVMTFNQVAA